MTGPQKSRDSTIWNASFCASVGQLSRSSRRIRLIAPSFFGSSDCPSEPDDLAVLEERTEQLIPTDHKAQSPSRGSPQSESFLTAGLAFGLIVAFVLVSGLRGAALASMVKDALVLGAVLFAGIVLPVQFFGSPKCKSSFVLRELHKAPRESQILQ
jgi:hypothetical protein